MCKTIKQRVKFKADPATARIPVIFLTAKTQRDETQRALALGAIACLTKPFDPMTLPTPAIDAPTEAASGAVRTGRLKRNVAPPPSLSAQMDPPVSPPMVSIAKLDAIATPLPELDPPGVRSGCFVPTSPRSRKNSEQSRASASPASCPASATRCCSGPSRA